MARREFRISSLLFATACELAEKALSARKAGLIEEEIRLSLATYSMAAFALEGAINQVGEAKLDPWVWNRLERAEPPLKWHIVSRILCQQPFEPGQEPMQTLVDLQQRWNVVAHPKSLEGSSDIIICYAHGEVVYDATLETQLKADGQVYLGYGRVLHQFNGAQTKDAVTRAYKALCELKDSTAYEGLAWVDQLRSLFPWLSE